MVIAVGCVIGCVEPGTCFGRGEGRRVERGSITYYSFDPTGQFIDIVGSHTHHTKELRIR